jgi:signal transduction histidine kinase
MRSDPHYVDVVMSGARADERSRDDRQEPPLVAGTVARELRGALDAVVRAAEDVSSRGRSLRDRLAVELVKAEARRALVLAESAAALSAEPTLVLSDVDLCAALSNVVDSLGLEARLSGTATTLYVPQHPCRVRGDERLLTVALAAILVSMQAVIDEHGASESVHVRLSPRAEGSMRTVEFSQRAVNLPPSALLRFFEASWPEHPAGRASAIRLAGAKAIAVLHRGRLDVSSADVGGCRVVMSIPGTE